MPKTHHGGKNPMDGNLHFLDSDVGLPIPKALFLGEQKWRQYADH